MVVRFQCAWPSLRTIAISHARFQHSISAPVAADSAAGRRAGEARPKGKYSRERMALAPIRARRIFPATGHARSQLFRLPTSFNQLSRHNAAFFGTFLGSKKVPSSSFPLFPSSFRPILHKKALSLIACLSHFESALFHPCFFSQALTCRKSTWGYSAIARS